MSNLNNSSNYGFQSLLYYRFIIEKKYRVDDVSKKMGICKDTLYRYIRGAKKDSKNEERKEFPIDQISSLVNATKDLRYLEYFCDPCGYTLLPKIKDKTTVKVISNIAKILQSAVESE